MTRLFVDEREVAFPCFVTSLDQLLKHVEATEVAPKYVIHQVNIDGTPVLSEFRAAVRPSIAERERIDIFTSPLDKVVQDSVREALSYLERAESVIPSLAASFQAYPGPEAFENLKQLYEGLYWLNLLIVRLEKARRVAPAEIQARGQLIQQHQDALTGILRQMVEAQERGDFILISDLLEYEVVPFVSAWKEMFAVFGSDAPARA